ncbi:MAG: SHOCT domain-containing protein [Lachnospiraceae bacterium]|nr:SHOCT domain-containing protein [Lachnospiraceae bacterium]
MSPYTEGLGNMSVEDVEEQIRIKEENDERFNNQFNITRQFDFDSRHPIMAVDDNSGEFALIKDARPDIFSFDNVISYNVDLNTAALSEEERQNDSSLMGILNYLLSDNFGSRFPDMPRCPQGCKVIGMYFEIKFGANPLNADRIRIDMLPGWSTSETEVDKAYMCANEIYQCFKEYKSGQRQAPAGAVQANTAAVDSASAIEQVKQLKELLDMGALTPDEFEKKKKELLNL